MWCVLRRLCGASTYGSSLCSSHGSRREATVEPLSSTCTSIMQHACVCTCQPWAYATFKRMYTGGAACVCVSAVAYATCEHTHIRLAACACVYLCGCQPWHTPHESTHSGIQHGRVYVYVCSCQLWHALCVSARVCVSVLARMRMPPLWPPFTWTLMQNGNIQH